MAQSGNMTAEDIGSILEAAHIYQRSGLLRAEYSEGKIQEKGELYLLAGRPIYARTGTLVGLEALNRLLGWRNVSFSFITDVPRPVANLASTARWKAEATSYTYVPALSRPVSSTAIAERVTAPMSFPELAEPAGSSAARRGQVLLQKNTYGIEQRVPQRTWPEQDPLSLRLTRRQRLIYFLVDGQHTVADLARTTGKAVQEVGLILDELREQGLVAF